MSDKKFIINRNFSWELVTILNKLIVNGVPFSTSLTSSEKSNILNGIYTCRTILSLISLAQEAKDLNSTPSIFHFLEALAQTDNSRLIGINDNLSEKVRITLPLGPEREQISFSLEYLRPELNGRKMYQLFINDEHYLDFPAENFLLAKIAATQEIQDFFEELKQLLCLELQKFST